MNSIARADLINGDDLVPANLGAGILPVVSCTMLYVETVHGTVLAVGENGDLTHTAFDNGRLVCLPRPLDLGAGAFEFDDGPLKGLVVVPLGSEDEFALSRAGKYLCAERDTSAAVCNRDVVGPWERFILSDHLPSSLPRGIEQFANRVSELVALGQPVKINLGSGSHPKPGFLNLDIQLACHPARNIDVFIFPFADVPWPISDDCVDLVFSEDFFEHISQKQQVTLLAEVLRVLRPGAYHRINTPSLTWSMRTHSDFRKGLRGVYVHEWDAYEHISILTKAGIDDLAKLVGYNAVTFNGKNMSLSPHAPVEVRPDTDRDQVEGNIFVDLQK